MSIQAKRYINLYTEASPNPDSIKIVFNLVITPEGKDFNFVRGNAVDSSPLVQELFSQFGAVSLVSPAASKSPANAAYVSFEGVICTWAETLA
jgi:hypothetical protein